MTDPYRPPGAKSKSPPTPLPTWAIGLGVVLGLPIPLVTIFVVPQFREVFANFGAELPLATRVLLDNLWIGVLWPVGLALEGWRTRVGGKGGLLRYLSIAGLGSAAVFAGVVTAMYLPIFKLAATI